MIRNYVKFAFRTILRNPLFSFIHISGLAILSALIAISITILTIGFQAVKAATANPVVSSKTDG
ncbi:MAG: hypothetical protein H7122_00320 [Chitinophagaceae bacterium]|nr:hypothetical protein [Chitinophagaceae bacterium]